MFGGKPATGQTDNIQRYDLTITALATVELIPVPFGHPLAFDLNGTIYIAGGRIGNSAADAANKVSTQVWSFDPTTNTVTPTGTLCYAVVGTAVIDDRAYTVGSETGGADTPTSAVIVILRRPPQSQRRR